MLHHAFRGLFTDMYVQVGALLTKFNKIGSVTHYIHALVWGNLVKPGVVSACPYIISKRGKILNNKLTFLNSAVALKEQDKADIKLYRKQMQTIATF